MQPNATKTNLREVILSMNVGEIISILMNYASLKR